MLRRGEGYLLDCEGPRTGDLGRRLMAYRLRADIALADATEDFRVIALFGSEGGDAAFGLPPGEGIAAPLEGGWIMRDPRGVALGLRAVLPGDADLAFLEQAGFARGSPADYERHRIAHGAPDGSRDMEVGRATLMECGFEALNGVDFEKGCYVGQELTARTKHRGLVRRRLAVVTLDGPLPPAGTPIVAGEREVGEIRSGQGGAALAGASPGEDRCRRRGGDSAHRRRNAGYSSRLSLSGPAPFACAMAACAAASRATGTR